MIRIPALLILNAFVLVAFGQITFTDGTHVYNPSLDLRSGNAGCVYDINGDGLDDVVIIHKANKMYVGYNMGPLMPIRWVEGPKVSSSTEYLALMTDVENDGIPELITAGSYSNTKLYRLADDGSFQFSKLYSHNILTQGGNAVDYNADGYLDLFLCSDESAPVLAANDGSGLFVTDVNSVDWTTVPSSDMSGNYGSEWADVDGDGDLDLYIAKCRAGITDPSNPMRINRLFINHGDTLIDEADERGMALGHQSWTGSFLDWDNDGDPDCVVTNHDTATVFMENLGNGYFQEVHMTSAPVNVFAFQSLCEDFDNDGYPDILILGLGGNYLLRNKEGTSFEVLLNPFGGIATNGLIADINNDGAADVFAFYSTNINKPGLQSDRIYINQTGSKNNYLRIALRGETSNRLGIGAQVRVYSDQGVQYRHVKGGESYGIYLSPRLHFGIGQSERVDSILVSWPSGIIDRVIPEMINTTVTIIEGRCSNPMDILYSEALYLCGNALELEAPVDQTAYLWSTGEETQKINVDQAGVYSVQWQDSVGCLTQSGPIHVQDGRITDRPILLPDSPYCSGEPIELQAVSGAKSYLWSNGDTTLTTQFTGENLIYLTVSDHCGNEVTDTITVVYVTGEVQSTRDDTVTAGGTAVLFAEGQNIAWYFGENDINPFHRGDSLILSNVQQSTTYYVENTVLANGPVVIGGMKEAQMDNHLHNNGLSRALYFSSFQPIIIESAVLGTLIEGTRKFVVLDDALNQIDAVEVFVRSGTHRYTLNLQVPPGELYTLGTDAEFNVAQFGTTSPQLFSNINNIDYPYEFGSVMDVLSSTGGRFIYPYFFDLAVSYNNKYCTGERVGVTAYLDTDVSTKETPTLELKIYPNPTSDLIRFTGLPQGEGSFRLKIYDATGRLVKRMNLEGATASLGDLPNGMYLLVVSTSSGMGVSKLIVQSRP